MKKLLRMVLRTGSGLGTKLRSFWSRTGGKATAKLAAWASKHKNFLTGAGYAAIGGTAASLTARIVGGYFDAKSEVVQRWSDSTGISDPIRASAAKRVKAVAELRDLVNKYAGYGYASDKDDEYNRILVRIIELMNLLVVNEDDDEARRIGVRALSIIPGCAEAGVMPEEGFSSPLVMRSLRNLSEDGKSAQDIEAMLDSVLDVATSGAPLKNI